MFEERKKHVTSIKEVPNDLVSLRLIDMAIAGFLGWSDFKKNDQEGKCPYLGFPPGFNDFRISVPSYTMDKSFAWMLFDMIRSSGRFCCLEMKSDYAYTLGLSLTEEYFETPNFEQKAINFPAAKDHRPSIVFDVPDLQDFSILFALAFVWANHIEVPGVEMPWASFSVNGLIEDFKRLAE